MRRVDMADIVAVLGFLILALGLGLYDWRLVLILLGATLAAVGLRAAMREP